jgi:serine/threonine protein kinase
MPGDESDAPATVNERPGPRPEAQGRAPLADGGNEARYRRGAELGTGGMGRVVEATDTVLGRTVAVKEIREADGELALRFEREVYVTARLEHPAIVPVYDAGRTGDGLPFYVMRRVTGRPLDAVIAEATGLDGRLALIPNVLAAVDAVAHAHNRGVIHRDLKPGNVLVGDHGETLVIDWGLAKLVDEATEPALDPSAGTRPAPVGGTLDEALHTRIGSVIGTPGFMPPEQALGTDVDARGDVYALGATLYQVLAGKPPWSGAAPTEILDRVVHEAPPHLAELVPGVPPDLVAIVEKAMARDRASRYADAGALGDDLRRFLRGQLVAAHRYSPRQRLARWLRRNRAAIAVGTAAVVALVVVAVLSLSRILDDRDRIAQSERRTRAALSQAEDQNDRLLLETARAALDTDPTYALARLADLTPTSRRWSQARAVASAARARGITMAFAATNRTPWGTQMSPGGRWVTVFDAGSAVVIHDLTERTTALLVIDSEIGGVAWTGPSQLAVAVDTAITFRELDAGPPPPPLTSPAPVVQLFGANGALAWRTKGDRVFATTGGAIAELPVPAGTADWVRFSDDGTLLAIAGKRGFRVHRHDGAAWREVLRGDGRIDALAIAPGGGRLATITEQEIREWIVDGEALVPRGPWPSRGLGDLDYAGDHLLVSWMRESELVDYHGDEPVPLVQHLRFFPVTVAGIGPGAIALAEADRLTLATRFRRISIPLREFPLHVQARLGAPFVVVTGHAYVTVVDLREVWPYEIPINASGGMACLAPNSLMIDALGMTRVLDVDKGTVTDHGPTPLPRVVDPFDRVILGPTGEHNEQLFINRIDLDAPFVLPMDGAITVTVRGDELYTGTEAGDVVVRPLSGDAPRRVVANLGSPVIGVHDRGPWLSATAEDGALWRRGPRGDETARVPGAPRSSILGGDGTVYVAVGRDVYRWPPGGAIALLAHADFDLYGFLYPGTRAIAVVGEDQAVYRLDLADGSIRASLPTGRWGYGVSLDGSTGARLDDKSVLHVADLEAGEGWTVPTGAELTTSMPSSDGRQIFAAGGGNGVLRYFNDLPAEPAALRDWIVRRTNARAGAQFGAVEWQLPEPTRVR